MTNDQQRYELSESLRAAANVAIDPLRAAFGEVQQIPQLRSDEREVWDSLIESLNSWAVLAVAFADKLDEATRLSEIARDN